MFKFWDFKLDNFLSCADLTKDQTIYLIKLAQAFKNNQISFENSKSTLGLIFEKASTRTRISFMTAMNKLGGMSVELNPNTSQIGRGEPIKDTARVLSRYCDVIAIRTFKQEFIEEFALWSSVPVINALTDLEHPCQILADFLTIKEEFDDFNNVSLTFIGDGNNVANSLLLCSAILGIDIRIACPKGYEPSEKIIAKAKNINKKFKFMVTNDIRKAVNGANVLYTDVWSSMGQEAGAELKDKKFEGFSINKKTIEMASSESIVLHCLPAYRDKEITDEVIDSERSRIFNQAENRMYAQQALLYHILNHNKN